jgi:hypothetical protein
LQARAPSPSPPRAAGPCCPGPRPPPLPLAARRSRGAAPATAAAHTCTHARMHSARMHSAQAGNLRRTRQVAQPGTRAGWCWRVHSGPVWAASSQVVGHSHESYIEGQAGARRDRLQSPRPTSGLSGWCASVCSRKGSRKAGCGAGRKGRGGLGREGGGGVQVQVVAGWAACFSSH